MWSRNCFCSFCYVDSIFACFYKTGQLKLIRQKFQLAGVVLVVSNLHVFNLTRQLESKPLEFPTLAATNLPFFRLPVQHLGQDNMVRNNNMPYLWNSESLGQWSRSMSHKSIVSGMGGPVWAIRLINQKQSW